MTRSVSDHPVSSANGLQTSIFCQTKSPKEQQAKTAVRMNNFLQSVERRAFITAKLATQDEEEALDIVQEAMLKLAQKYLDRSDAEWGALFTTILQSKINDWHRRQQVRSRWRVLIDYFRKNDQDIDLDDLAVQELFPEPDRQLMADHLGENLLTLISHLPLRQQQALTLRAWEGYDIAQTAKIMKCSSGSVKTHYSRAIHNLRDKLEEYR